MLRPNKRVVGVTIDLEREEYAVLDEIPSDFDEETSIQADILEENEVSLVIEEFLEDNTPTFDSTVDVTGKQKHKATVIRELFNESGSSLDRLHHVRTYSKFPYANSNDHEAGDVELDSMIMLVDHVCGKVVMEGGCTTLCIGKIASMKYTIEKKYKTVSPLSKIVELLFQVNIYHGRVINSILILKDQTSDLLIWKGNLCVLIDLRGMCWK